MNKITLVILLLCSYLIGFGQEFNPDAQEYEKQSLEAFKSEDWSATISACKLAFQEGLNYPALHYRIGLAYYHLEKYKEAIPYLETYMKDNKRDPMVQIYIYYCYYFQNLPIEANNFIKNKHKYAKYKTNYKVPNPVKYLNIENGIKTSNLRDSVGRLIFLNINSLHEITHNLSFKSQISNIKQPMYWGTFDQSQYSPGILFYLGNKWTLSSNYYYFHMKANVRLQYDDISTLIPNTNTIAYTTDSSLAVKKGRGHIVNLGINRYFNEHNHTLAINSYRYQTDETLRYYFHNPNIDSVLTYDTNITEAFTTTQLDLNSKFYPSILNYNLTLGINQSLIFSGDSMLYRIKPSIQYKINQNWSFYSDYMRINTRNFLENEAAIIHNGIDISNWRMNFMINYHSKSDIDLYSLIQLERKTDEYINKKINYRNIVVGLKMNL